MADLIDALPRQDRRLVELMAADAETSASAMLAQIVRAYLGLARSAPEALPNDPMRRLATRAGGAR
jgi:hypothetical protein